MRAFLEIPRTSRLRAARRALATCFDAWLPASCIVCAADHRAGICPACEQALTGYRAARCPRCGLASKREPVTCSGCLAAAPAFDATLVLADYAAPLDRVVHALKFGRDASLAAPLGRCLASYLRTQAASLAPYEARATGVVATAIPLSTTRLAERGFNQSLEIARALSGELSIACDHRWLRRVRDGAPASTLHAGERHRALRGAFQAPRALDGRVVIVVDDVMTTGATLQAAAEALKYAGASFVVNCVVARTPVTDAACRPGSS